MWIIKQSRAHSKTPSCYLGTICSGGLNDLQLQQSRVTSVPILHNKTLIYCDGFPLTIFHLIVVFTWRVKRTLSVLISVSVRFPKAQLWITNFGGSFNLFRASGLLSLCVIILSGRSSGTLQPFNRGVLAFCGISLILLSRCLQTAVSYFTISL